MGPEVHSEGNGQLSVGPERNGPKYLIGRGHILHGENQFIPRRNSCKLALHTGDEGSGQSKAH